MSGFVAREVAGREDVRQVQRIASRCWPAGWHPGGLGWALARDELGTCVVLGDPEGAVLGWAASEVHGPGSLLAQVDREHPRAAAAVAAWIPDTTALPMTIEVYDLDAPLTAALSHAGFVAQHDRPLLGMVCPAGRGVVDVPGYTVRPVRDDEFDARIEVHRAAWKPSELPWTDGRRADPTGESSFDAAAYERVRDTWQYRQNLDLVAVAEDGSLAGCCIAWWDPATGVAEIEPLGVAPGHRRRGLAVALCHDVARRVHDLGGREVFINTGPIDGYPAPSAAYLKAGFTIIQRGTTFLREATPQPV